MHVTWDLGEREREGGGPEGDVGRNRPRGHLNSSAFCTPPWHSDTRMAPIRRWEFKRGAFKGGLWPSRPRAEDPGSTWSSSTPERMLLPRAFLS